MAAAQTAPTTAPADKTENITVKAPPPPKTLGLGKLPGTLQNTAQTVDVISKATIQHQAATSLEDALRYAPGVTLNSGEGGAHGDNINLRGFHAIDSFFLDGIRDPGSYTRDNFDVQSLQVLQGPASVLFGNGPAGGVVNQTSKEPTLAPKREIDFETGTNREARATVDVNEPLSDTAAFRINAMGNTNDVAGRDYVQQRRYGIAPSISLGINTDTQFTLNYLYQEESDIPDYGIPFLYGKPAAVNPSLYYGLKDKDLTAAKVNIVNAVLKQNLNDDWQITNTLRYASYWSAFRVSAPHFGDDFTGGAPAPGTPLSDIMIYRDRPSSAGVQSYLTDHIDLTGNFDIGPFANTLITGVELGRQSTDYVRYDNEFEGIDGIAPVPLLSPNVNEYAPWQHTIVARPDTDSDMLGIYAVDRIKLTTDLNFDAGVRFDDYDTHLHDSVVGTDARRQDTGVSPKLALVYQPRDGLDFYAAYTTSFDPAVSYLTLAGNDTLPKPQTAETYEVGSKIRWYEGMLNSTVAIFRTDSAHVTISDPDDPTLQEIPGTDQRVQGVELTTYGYVTSQVEVNVNYTYLDPQISQSSTPGELGRMIPGAAHNNANIWVDYYPDDVWQFSGGANFVDHRFADTLNTANIPGYVIFNAMVGYQLTDQIHLQMNIQNIGDTKYFTGAYYSDATENHVLPGQGRVFTFNARFNF